MRRVLWLAVIAAVLSHPAPGHANARFPEANQLIVEPGDPRHLVVRTTFGLVRTFDGGVTWSWTCEDAIAPLGLLDEELLMTRGGRTSVAVSDGLALSDRAGCAWSHVTGDLEGHTVMDLAGDPHDPAQAYAGVEIVIAGALNGRIARTTDGETWSFIGDLLPATVPLTIEIAPSRPVRLYMGVNDGDFAFGYIDVSDDAGLTWSRHAAPHGVDSVYVSAVDPTDPDRLYVRSTFPENTLYVSEDGAATWTAVFTAAQPLTGLALSPDGAAVAVGSADGVTVLARAGGGGAASSFTPSPGAAVNAKCLTWTAAGLYVCADETADGFTIGLSGDQGKTFRSLLHLPDLVQAWCPTGTTVTQTCPTVWCPLASTFGASCAPAVMPSAAGAARASGCGCRTADAPDAPWSVTLAAAGLILVCGRRRRAKVACQFNRP